MAWTKTANVKGSQGPTGPPAHTLSTSAFTVPAIGGTVVVSVADASWVALGEVVYVQDAGGAGVAGALQVTAKTPTSLTLLNLAVSTGGGGGTGSGDMAKAVYDTNNNNVVDLAEAVPWIGITGKPSIIWGEAPLGSINGINQNYTTASPYTPGLLAVFLNGLRLQRTNDYVETGSQSFQLVNAPLSGDSLIVDYM